MAPPLARVTCRLCKMITMFAFVLLFEKRGGGLCIQLLVQLLGAHAAAQCMCLIVVHTK